MELCRHIFLDGRFCRGAAVKDGYFCRHHNSVRATLTQARRAAPHHSHQLLPFAYPEDRKAIELNLFLVQNALNEGAIPPRTANAFTNIMRAQMANLTRIEKAEAAEAARLDTDQAASSRVEDGGPLKPSLSGEQHPSNPETNPGENPGQDLGENLGQDLGENLSKHLGAPSFRAASPRERVGEAEIANTSNELGWEASEPEGPAFPSPSHDTQITHPPSATEDKDPWPPVPELAPEPYALRPVSAQTAIHQMYERFFTEEGEEIAPPRYFPNPDHCHLAKPEASAGS